MNFRPIEMIFEILVTLRAPQPAGHVCIPTSTAPAAEYGKWAENYVTFRVPRDHR